MDRTIHLGMGSSICSGILKLLNIQRGDTFNILFSIQ